MKPTLMEMIGRTTTALIECGLRVYSEKDIENILAGTPLAKISFANGDRTLASFEFVCAYENIYGGLIPRYVCDKIASRIDNGRGTVAELAAVLERWENPPPRPRRKKANRAQMTFAI